MALTVTEAKAVNELLGWVLGRPKVSRGQAQLAAEILANRAHRTLRTGLNAQQIRRMWPGAEASAEEEGDRAALHGACADEADAVPRAFAVAFRSVPLAPEEN
jgi:hypothetical protein